MDSFTWAPGQGCDLNSLLRLKSHFPKPPPQPMGEAWFMGDERHMFNNLSVSADCLSIAELYEAFEEITSGLSAFGYLEEWWDWYHYLLVTYLEKANQNQYKDNLIENCVSGYIACYSLATNDPPYKEFENDVLNTLGRMIMNPGNWNGSNIVIGNILHQPAQNSSDPWGWWEASSDLSSSLFFCLKHLPDRLINCWFKSVLEIPSPHWKAQLLVWLVGAHPLIAGDIRKLSKLPDNPHIGWEGSYLLSGHYTRENFNGTQTSEVISINKRKAISTCINEYFSEDSYIEWLEIISKHDYLMAEITGIINTFETLFIYKKIKI